MIDIKKQLELASANQTGKPKVTESGIREYKHVEMAKEKNSKSETLDELFIRLSWLRRRFVPAARI